ncbi:hypothetical protein, partial [Rhodovulum sulfidophilum]|uniref:hypothetical protein n=1 Tax=Rhodovulum sulfidophilum TaxID=35806 RepID=UPI001F275755
MSSEFSLLVFWLLSLACRVVVLLFAEILPDFTLRGWTSSTGLAHFVGSLKGIGKVRDLRTDGLEVAQ